MNDPAYIIAIATLITAVSGMLTGVASLIVSLKNSRGIEKVRHVTNSLMDARIALTEKSSHAEGVKEEKDRQELKSDGVA